MKQALTTEHPTELAQKERRTLVRVALAGVIPLAAIIVLFTTDVPIGQPHLIYRYSPWWVLRIWPALVAVLISVPTACALFAALKPTCRRRVPLAVCAIIGYIALVVWTLFAPPNYVEQHVFNLESPSHDGAFVLESREVSSVNLYVSETFYKRLALEPQDMRGRRVLSNPPGTTILAVLCRRAVDASPSLKGWLIDVFDLEAAQDPEKRDDFAADMALAIVFTMIWGCAIIFGYRLCRLWMSPLPSAAVALACVFNPSTVDFTPGKDPAQLVTVLALAWTWMAAYQRKSRQMGCAAGVVVAFATMIGLIHMWILAIVAGATLWHSLKKESSLRSWITCCTLPATAGAAVVALLAYLTLDWNIALTALMTGLKYGRIQENVITDPLYWTLVGLPMFLLFIGPMLWSQLLTMRRDTVDSPAVLGRYVLTCTVVVLTFTYLTANNNETPRLWMPFIPLLIVGMALGRSAFRARSARSRRVCCVLILLQLFVTVAHWSLMDVRESEYRLSTGRMFD